MRIKRQHIRSVLLSILVLFSTSYVMPDQDGSLIVSNNKKGIWNDTKRIVIEEELIIGQEYGAEAEMFSYIRDMALDQQDNLYVVDSMEVCVKIFDSKGKFVRVFGREGQGPGEFQTIDDICWSQEDHFLYIADRRNHRISWFAGDGEFCGSINTGKFHADITSINCLENGRFVLTARITGDRSGKHKIIVTTHDFEDVVADIEEEFPVYSVGAEISPNFSDVGILFGEQIYYTSPSDYSITILSPEYEKSKIVSKSAPRMFPPHYVKGFFVDFNTIESLFPWEGHFIVGVQSTLVKDIPRFKEKRELIEFVYMPDLKEWKLKTAYQLDFYNHEFQFLGHVEIPNKRRLAGKDSQERIYFIENEPFPRIIRSQILMDEKN